MKLKKIIVNELFGSFYHEVEIKNQAGITIIIGENGLGKTVLLELIEAFFQGKFNYINSIVFKKLTFEFTDGVMWSITKDESPEHNCLLLTEASNDCISKCIIKLHEYDNNLEIRDIAINIARKHSFLRRISPSSWEDRKTGHLYRANDIISNFGAEYIFNDVLSNEGYPDWFKKRFKEIDVTLIRTQRLLRIDDDDDRPIHTVEMYSEELSRLINNKLTESTEFSSKLDRTYPNRLIDKLKRNEVLDISNEELNDSLNKLEQKRSLLDQVGLMELEKKLGLPKISNSDKVLKSVLMLYIQDSVDKLAIFDDITNKIKLLLEIINTRFKHKQLYINRENGFVFKSTVVKSTDGNYQTIPVSKLSSGEQNELVLFYELIFKTNYNSLILIDEPEISLHISWQSNFISDLRKIHDLNLLDIIITTHSPDIISNNWNLKVELKGVE